MKTVTILFGLLVACTLQGGSQIREYYPVEEMQKDGEACRVKNRDVFVVLVSGDTIAGKKIRDNEIKHRITLDGKDYSNSEVSCFQTNDELKAVDGSKYLTYLRRGKMNLFTYTMYTKGSNLSGIVRFMKIEKEIDKKIFLEVTETNLREMLSDNEKALEFCNSVLAGRKKDSPLLYTEVKPIIELYNK